MGKQTSKVLDLLYIDSASLDPPNPYQDKKTNRTKEMKLDYSTYKPKKYYSTDASDEQVQRHLKLLQQKQNLLKQFKYHQDFDRIDSKEMDLNTCSTEVLIEEAFKYSILGSFLSARWAQVQLTGEYVTNAGWRKIFYPLVIVSVPIYIARVFLSPQYHVINHQFFRVTNPETALRNQLDIKLDIYKDVQDMKYNYKLPTVRQFYSTKFNFHEQQQLLNKPLYRSYYQYINGMKIDDCQQFLNERAKNRKDEQGIDQIELAKIKQNITK